MIALLRCRRRGPYSNSRAGQIELGASKEKHIRTVVGAFQSLQLSGRRDHRPMKQSRIRRTRLVGALCLAEDSRDKPVPQTIRGHCGRSKSANGGRVAGFRLRVAVDRAEMSEVPKV